MVILYLVLHYHSGVSELLSPLELPIKIVQQKMLAQSQQRVPEPTSLMDGDSRPETYNAGGDSTNLWAIHAFVGDLAAAIGPEKGEALDLACGTGNVARRLAQQLPTLKVLGVDLSNEMLELARRPRLDPATEGRLSFQTGDMLDLSHFEDGRFSLTTWTLAAHHAPGPDEVASTIRQMDRITSKEGAIIIFDLGRLKTPALNKWYVNFAGKNYNDVLFQEFSQSVHAAYTTQEMQNIAQKSGVERLTHCALSGLPTLQVLYRPAHSAGTTHPLFADSLADYHNQSAATIADYETICRLFGFSGLKPKQRAI